MLKLTVPIGPSVNHYLQHYCDRSSKLDPHIVRAKLTDRAKQYREEVGWTAKQIGVDMIEAGIDVALDIKAYQQHNKPKLDADNILKMVIDSLNGIAWADDKQVQDIHIRLYVVEKGPHLDVSIREADEKGGEKDGIVGAEAKQLTR